MTELQMKTETIHTVDYENFNSWVDARFADTPRGQKLTAAREAQKDEEYPHYVHGYEFVADMESSNYVDHRFDIDGKLSEWDVKELDKFKDGENPIMMARAILQEAAHVGDIPTGTYLISVFW